MSLENPATSARYDDMFSATRKVLDQLDAEEFLGRMGAFFTAEDARADAAASPDRKIRTIGIFVATLRGGGAEKVAVNLSTSWLNRGYRVVVFADEPANPGDYPLHEKLERVALPAARLDRWNAVRENVLAKQVDLCIFFDGWSRRYQYDFFSAKLAGCLTIQSVHNQFFSPVHEFRPVEIEWLIEYAPYADALTCLSEDNLLWWRASGVARSAFIPNQVDLDPARAIRSDGTTKNVLFIGRLTDVKGVRFLPRIVRKIADLVPDFKLQVLGQSYDGQQDKWLKKEFAALDVSKNVEMRGFVKNVNEFIAGAAVLIMPSRYEGQPLVRLEAAAQGVPNVIFSMPYLEKIREEDGCIQVGKEDVDGLARATARLLTDQEYWRRMSDNAVRSVLDFSEDNILAQWDRLFASILANRVEEDFRPTKPVDAAFLAETMEEVRIAFRQRRLNDQSFFYRYMHPDGKIMSFILPKGTLRRRAAAWVGHWIQQRVWELRARRRQQNESK